MTRQSAGGIVTSEVSTKPCTQIAAKRLWGVGLRYVWTAERSVPAVRLHSERQTFFLMDGRRPLRSSALVYVVASYKCQHVLGVIQPSRLCSLLQ